jgi:hypothetical protein
MLPSHRPLLSDFVKPAFVAFSEDGLSSFELRTESELPPGVIGIRGGFEE